MRTRVERRLDGAFHPRGEGGAVERFVHEGLHGAQRVQGFLGLRAEIGDAVLCDARGAFLAPAEQHQRADHQRHHGEHHQRELRTGGEQHDQRADQDQRAAHPLRNRRTDQRLQQRGVGVEPRQQLAGAGGFVEGRRQREQPLEGGPAQIGGDPLAEPGHQVEPQGGGGPQGGNHREHHQGGVVQSLRAVAGEAVVDQLAYTLAKQQHQACRHQQRQQGGGDAQTIGPQERQQAAHDGDGRTLALRRQ